MKTIKTKCLVDLEGNPLVIRVNERTYARIKRIRTAAWETGQRFKLGLISENQIPDDKQP